jgi:hypothetical protein
VSKHTWAAVALRSGSIPPPAVMRAWLDRYAPKLVVVDKMRDSQEANAEHVFDFVEGQASVGAAHFPWTIGTGDVAGPFKEHESHVFLSVSEPGRQNGREGRRLLARATSAIATTADAAFVWWGRTGGVYTVRKFVERIEKA